MNLDVTADDSCLDQHVSCVQTSHPAAPLHINSEQRSVRQSIMSGPHRGDSAHTHYDVCDMGEVHPWRPGQFRDPASDRMTPTARARCCTGLSRRVFRRRHPIVESSWLIEPATAALAQLVEHRSCKANVESSTLSRGSILVGAQGYRRLVSDSCPGCGVDFAGCRPKVYCSNACQQSHRRRLLLEAWLR
jgi:hypothetical protein